MTFWLVWFFLSDFLATSSGFVCFMLYVLTICGYWVQVKMALQQAKGRQQKRTHRNVSPPALLCSGLEMLHGWDGQMAGWAYCLSWSLLLLLHVMSPPCCHPASFLSYHTRLFTTVIAPCMNFGWESRRFITILNFYHIANSKISLEWFTGKREVDCG